MNTLNDSNIILMLKFVPAAFIETNVVDQNEGSKAEFQYQRSETSDRRLVQKFLRRDV